MRYDPDQFPDTPVDGSDGSETGFEVEDEDPNDPDNHWPHGI
jgi:hypothetical protein